MEIRTGSRRKPRRIEKKQEQPNEKYRRTCDCTGGKSECWQEHTVYALTGLHQHVGNWSGKTVENAQGSCQIGSESCTIIDVPGCYSLMARSAEEEVARDFLCFGKPDGILVVCDAGCLERGLNLVLQILEVTKRVIVCVNLMDEARKKKISIDLKKLRHHLGVPVVACLREAGKESKN